MINYWTPIELLGVVVLVGCLFFLMLDRIANRAHSLGTAALPRPDGVVNTAYCSKCGQRLPKPWFRIVNGPAALLFVWPALDFLGYGLIPEPQAFFTWMHGTGLVVCAALTVAVYAWIARSGR